MRIVYANTDKNDVVLYKHKTGFSDRTSYVEITRNKEEAHRVELDGTRYLSGWTKSDASRFEYEGNWIRMGI